MRRVARSLRAFEQSLRADAEQRASPAATAMQAAPQNYDDEEYARGAIGRIALHTMVSYPRLVTLWQQVRHLDAVGIPGALVECGTWRGGASALMALAHAASGPPSRNLHLFDSFEGLPEPHAELDGRQAVRLAEGRGGGALRGIGVHVAEARKVRQLLAAVGYPERLTHLHEGWFQDSVPAEEQAIGVIALLRLDGDWYESTRIPLEHLYPRVAKGGFVVIDDYGKFEGARRAVDEYLDRLGHRPFLHHVDAAGRYLMVPQDLSVSER